MAQENSPQVVRVRIAPSPTGFWHIGNTRTALYNYFLAKKNNGKFILRIEDTDRERYVPEAVDNVIEALKWLGLNYDEGPGVGGNYGSYVQSERLDLYKKHAKELVEKKLAYEDNGAIRFKTQKTGKTVWHDLIGNKDISFENKTQEDFVILKTDGYPTYNFANVIDDHCMEISHVVRGPEFISSTPKHLMLYKAFGWQPPIFAHVPLILGPDKAKLSKRHGAKPVLEFRDDGYMPEAILNYMALLGWTPPSGKEILSISEMIEEFDIKDVNVASPIFDEKKLLWFNGIYIRQAQNSKLKNVDEQLLDQLISLAQTRMNTLNDFFTLTQHFFEEPDIKLNEEEKQICKDLIDRFSTMKQFNNEAILEVIKQVLSDNNFRMPVLYKILTGSESGLPLPQSLEILGKEKVISRLNKILHE